MISQAGFGTFPLQSRLMNETTNGTEAFPAPGQLTKLFTPCIYVFFAIMCFLGLTWAWAFVPETKGKTLGELDDVFGDATGQEEHEVMRSVSS